MTPTKTPASSASPLPAAVLLRESDGAVIGLTPLHLSWPRDSSNGPSELPMNPPSPVTRTRIDRDSVGELAS